MAWLFSCRSELFLTCVMGRTHLKFFFLQINQHNVISNYNNNNDNNGGMGADCNCFLEHLAERLSEKNEELLIILPSLGLEHCFLWRF